MLMRGCLGSIDFNAESVSCVDMKQKMASTHTVYLCHQYFPFYQFILVNTLQSATGGTGLLSQGLTAVNHECSVHALGPSLVNS